MKRAAFTFVAALSLGVVLLSTHAGIVRSQSSPGTSQQRDDRERVKRDFVEALTMVQDNYAGRFEPNDLTKASILGMLHVLDPHSNYFDPKDWEEFQTEQQSQYFGIGATIVPRNGHTFIHAPFAGTPAERAGLKYGDEIIKVDDTSTEGLQSGQVSEKMRGPRGTTVRITVRRPGVANPITVSIIRDAVPLPSLSTSFILQPGVGYVQLNRGFQQTTADELEEAMSQLQSQGMNSLILDMRDNPGGFIDQAVRVASNFLSRGQKVVSVKGLRYPQSERLAHPAVTEQFPVVAVINGNSASATEIVAGALQDHDRAVIVGERSFGKGLVQGIFQLPYGAGLTLTTGKYYTPSGRLIQREYNGVSYYDYITRRNADGDATLTEGPTKDQKVTDTGRTVYGGGGINPDVHVKTGLLSPDEVSLIGPIFSFTREASRGLIRELPSWKSDMIERNHLIAANELEVTDDVLKTFKRFLAAHSDLARFAEKVDANKAFVQRQMRYEMAVAHYGVEAAVQVLVREDPQIVAAVQQLPQAEKLARNFVINSKRSSLDSRPNQKPGSSKN